MNSKQGKKWKSSALLKKLLVIGPHTCPWRPGYTFDSPLRRFIHRPESILGKFLSPGDTAVDVGCGLGYFSITLAEMVGSTGRVVAFDFQAQMVKRAQRRAERRGMADRIHFRVCALDHLCLDGEADLVLALWMLHGVFHPGRLLAEIRSVLRPSGHLMIAEPRLHVSKTRFSATIELAKKNGCSILEGPRGPAKSLRRMPTSLTG